METAFALLSLKLVDKLIDDWIYQTTSVRERCVQRNKTADTMAS